MSEKDTSPPTHVEAERIAPMLTDLTEFLTKHAPEFDAVEVCCALTNAMLWVFAGSTPPAKLIIAQNFANIAELVAKKLEASLQKGPVRVQ